MDIVIIILYFYFWSVVGLLIHLFKSISVRRGYIKDYGLRRYLADHAYALAATLLFLLVAAQQHATGVPDILGKVLVINDTTKEFQYAVIGFFSMTILKWITEVGKTRLERFIKSVPQKS